MIRKLKYLALFKQTTLMMIVLMTILGMVPRVDAAFIHSFESLGQEYQAKDLETIRHFLEVKAVQTRLQSLGYSSEEIQARLSNLSNEEIHQLASNINTLTPGGDAAGVIISILVIILLVLLILRLMDRRVIVR
jgi:uncharacterized membrane protein